jgi:hypothetical protein
MYYDGIIKVNTHGHQKEMRENGVMGEGEKGDDRFLKLGGDNCKHLQSLCLVILICFILCCKCGPFYLPFPLFSVFFLFARKSSQRKEEKQPRFTCARLRKTKPSESICILPSHP